MSPTKKKQSQTLSTQLQYLDGGKKIKRGQINEVIADLSALICAQRILLLKRRKLGLHRFNLIKSQTEKVLRDKVNKHFENYLKNQSKKSKDK